jgi:hypothetical protein
VLTVQELVADLTQAGAVDILGQLLKSEAPAVASGAAEMLAFLFHIRSVTVEVTDGAFESTFVRCGQVLASLRSCHKVATCFCAVYAHRCIQARGPLNNALSVRFSVTPHR